MGRLSVIKVQLELELIFFILTSSYLVQFSDKVLDKFCNA